MVGLFASLLDFVEQADNGFNVFLLFLSFLLSSSSSCLVVEVVVIVFVIYNFIYNVKKQSIVSLEQLGGISDFRNGKTYLFPILETEKPI